MESIFHGVSASIITRIPNQFDIIVMLVVGLRSVLAWLHRVTQFETSVNNQAVDWLFFVFFACLLIKTDRLTRRSAVVWRKRIAGWRETVKTKVLALSLHAKIIFYCLKAIVNGWKKVTRAWCLNLERSSASSKKEYIWPAVIRQASETRECLIWCEKLTSLTAKKLN